MSIANMREGYHQGRLDRSDVRGVVPRTMLERSLHAAQIAFGRTEGSGLLADPRRFVLGTVERKSRRPAATPVWFRSWGDDGIRIAVARDSPALAHLTGNPRVALLFHSQATQRQLRGEGNARVVREEAVARATPAQPPIPAEPPPAVEVWSEAEAERVLRQIRDAKESYGAASKFGLPALDPNAMVVVTGQPLPDGTVQASARVVLTKGCDARGLDFYTNKDSAKGQALRANLQAAFSLFWPTHSLRFDAAGRVVDVEAGEADAYWDMRPLLSRYGSGGSPQSERLSSRSELIGRVAWFAARHGLRPRRPGHWGGFRLEPEFFQWSPERVSSDHGSACRSDEATVDVLVLLRRFEAWQGGAFGRLHDRWLWEMENAGTWLEPYRLSP